LEAADARWIVLSYNSEGIIPFAELYELLAAYGAVEIETRDYTVYRGGRQSISRKTHNQEFQLLLTRGSETPPGERQRFTRFLREQRLLTLLQEPYVPARLTAEFSGRDGAHARLRLFPRDEQARWETDRFHRFTGRFSREDLAPYSLEELEECARRLERAVCADRREEFTVLYRFLSAPLRDAAPERAPGGLDAGRGGAAPLRRDERRIMEVLRKFAHRKYAEQFHADCEKLRTLLRAHPGRLPLIEEQLPVLKELARRRFRG
jgi:adenine-specific DNA-methyltransferase